MAEQVADAVILELVDAGATNPEIARRLGISTRTLDRWRSRRPELSWAIQESRARQRGERPLPPHGTRSRYDRGCKCGECREAHNAACRATYARRGEAAAAGARAERVAMRTAVEQLIARGRSNSQIMAELGVRYGTVRAVRGDLERVSRESERPHRRRSAAA